MRPRAVSVRVATALFAAGLIAAVPARVGAQADFCGAAEQFAETEAALPHTAAALAKDRRLVVAVVGTGSSTLPGTDGRMQAYPAQLQQALTGALGAAVTVTTLIRPRRTAAQLAKEFAAVLAGKPQLVVWQTGTVDAMQGLDADAFQAALEDGVKALRAGGADVVLMNMQYSPRTETMIAEHGYADVMRFVSQQEDVPLFDRLEAMRHWNQAGTFDLTSPDKPIETAARVHYCVAELLAQMIRAGIGHAKSNGGVAPRP